MEKKDLFTSEIIDRLWRFARTILRSGEDAEDIVQDTLAKAWANPFTMNSPEAYLMRSVRNACIDQLRTKKEFTDEFPEIAEPGFVDGLNDKDLVYNALSHLSEQQRMIVHLKDIEGYPISEISQMMGLQENHIRTILSRARKAMRENIETELNYGNRH